MRGTIATVHTTVQFQLGAASTHMSDAIFIDLAAMAAASIPSTSIRARAAATAKAPPDPERRGGRGVGDGRFPLVPNTIKIPKDHNLCYVPPLCLTDGHDPVMRLQHIPVARHRQSGGSVRHKELRL